LKREMLWVVVYYACIVTSIEQIASFKN